MSACVPDTRAFEFEGQSVTTYFIDDRPCWLARDVGVLLGYSHGGKRLANKVAGEWAEEFVANTDFLRLDGKLLSSFKLLLEGTDSVPSMTNSSLTVLFESGVNLASMLTRKPLGRRLRRWLAEEVLPALRRTGRYEVPAAEHAPRVELRQLREERLRMREERLRDQEERLVRSGKAGAVREAADRAFAAGAIDEISLAAHYVSAAEMVLGHALPGLQPSLPEAWLTPTQIGERLGVSAQRVGLAITALGLRAVQPGIARKVQATTANQKVVESWQYAPAVVEQVRRHLSGEGAA